MNARDTLYLTTKADYSPDQLIAAAFRTLFQYIFCVGLGLLSGLTSVALTITVTVIAQFLLFPAITLTPSAITLTVIAAFMSLGFSWFISQATPRILPRLFSTLSERGVQTIFIFGVLASLLEALLFLRGM